MTADPSSRAYRNRAGVLGPQSAPPAPEGPEDEPDVQRMAERILTKNGYSVVGAPTGADAVKIFNQSEQVIDLLLTDVIMPEMLGPEFVEQVREIRPDLKVVYMSGYSHEVLAAQALTDHAHSAFIEKPFNTQALLEVIHKLLAQPAKDLDD